MLLTLLVYQQCLSVAVAVGVGAVWSVADVVGVSAVLMMMLTLCQQCLSVAVVVGVGTGWSVADVVGVSAVFEC